MGDDAFYRLTELDRTNWLELRDRIGQFAPDESHQPPRTYPGYPRTPLPAVKARLWPPLDRVLRSRRCVRQMADRLPDRKTMSRLLFFSHGIQDSLGRGPTPSSGGLQALELYLVNFRDGWLPAGLFHYDRADHCLSELARGAERAEWDEVVPSFAVVPAAPILFVLVGDGERVIAKYGPRGYRFLLLEAGHLMQNLCLLAASQSLVTVPLGGFLERDIAKQLHLPKADAVLYVGCCGTPAHHST